jgi:AGCS family alanine or glycine:cation symporter
VDIDSVAITSGESFHVEPGIVTTVSFATVNGRDVKWETPAGATAENIEKFRGGSEHLGWLYGLLLAVLVGVVIVGGIRRIGKVADKIVPVMCVLYVISGIGVLIVNASAVPAAIMTIFDAAFSNDALYGGFIGVIVQGVRRAAFSNEAGVGSAAIAHSAAKTKYPVREGLVALLEPFIDTIVICFMTGIVIVVTGVYADPATSSLEGVLLTGEAFGSALGDFAAYALSTAVVLFAFSTMISWSYYGERCWSFLFGNEQTLPYRLLFCGFVWLGCVSSLGNVLDFSDLMILSMAFPNILGVVILSGKIKRALDDYWKQYKDGAFDHGH